MANGHSHESLIQTAGARIADWVVTHDGDNAQNPIVIGLVGNGHNGADVLAAFNHLPRQYRRYAYFLCKPSKSAQKQIDSGQITRLHQVTDMPSSGIVLDGFFGVGLNRPLAGDMAQIISAINSLNRYVVAIDVPSGLHEAWDGPCITASVTLSMMFSKQVFLNPQKRAKCGTIYVLNFDLNNRDKNGYHFPKTIDKYRELVL